MGCIRKRNHLVALLVFTSFTVANAQKNEDKRALGLQSEGVFLEGMKAYLAEDFKTAGFKFQQIIKDFTPTAGVYHMLAKTHAAANEPFEAKESAKKSLEIEKDNAYYQQYLAECYLAAGEHEAAIDLYKKLIKRSPVVSAHYLALAGIYEKTGQPDKAIAVYDDLEKQLGLDEAISERKQALYLQQNKVSNAISEGKKLIGSSPAEPQYVLNQAQMLIANKTYAEAEALLKGLLDKNGQNGEANVMLAEIYRITGNTEACYEQLNSAFSNTELSPEIKLKVLGAFVHLSRKENSIAQTQRAIALAETLVKTAPKQAQAYIFLGDLYTDLNNIPQAQTNYRQATKYDKATFELWLALIETDLKLKDTPAVIKDAKEATDYFPNQAFFWYHYGLANWQSNNTEEAILGLEEARYLAQGNHELQSEISVLLWLTYFSVGQLKDAEQLFHENISPNLKLVKPSVEKLLATAPNNLNYLYLYNKILMEQADFQVAYQQASRVIAQTATNGLWLELSGDLLFQLGKPAEALEKWQLAKKHCPCSGQIDKKINEKQYFK